MAKKVTISVPDQLHEKMEKWRKSFNFSRIFQKAIGEAIRKKEEFRKRLGGDETMERIIERLRKEKEEESAIYYEEGREYGIEWAKASHYVSLKVAVEWDPHSGDAPDDEDIRDQLDLAITEDENRRFDTDEWHYHRWMTTDSAIKNYLIGWHDGVVEFWNEVKDKL